MPNNSMFGSPPLHWTFLAGAMVGEVVYYWVHRVITCMNQVKRPFTNDSYTNATVIKPYERVLTMDSLTKVVEGTVDDSNVDE